MVLQALKEMKQQNITNISGGSEFFKHVSLMTEDLLAILVAQIGASVPTQRV